MIVLQIHASAVYTISNHQTREEQNTCLPRLSPLVYCLLYHSEGGLQVPQGE